MNKSEDIVVSLEMAKKLKEAGWPQESSVFHWQWYEDDGESMYGSFPSEWQCYQMEASYEDYPDGECFAAPTAEELLERLRGTIKEDDGTKKWAVHFGFQSKGYVAHLYDGARNVSKGEQYTDTLANAAAAMYCYLKEHNLLKTEGEA